MEVDPPTSSSSPVQNSSSNLKRSNSAPMINMLVTSQPDISPPSVFKPVNSTALRRLSSSNMALHNTPASTSPPIRGTDRVARLKQEEIHIAQREREHEREIQSSLWISSNWGNLSFDSSEPMEGQQRRPRSYSESLHIMTQSNILCGSPSPTRAGVKQCFSPSMQIPVKNTTFTPSPSPSPTRKNFLRSLSPIAVRTGSLKRKLENDSDRWGDYISPPKKFNTGPSTPDRVMTCSHPLAHSISSSSLEGSSPEQMAPRSNNGGNMLHLPVSIGGRSPHALNSTGNHSPLSTSSGGVPSPHSAMSTGGGVSILPPTLLPTSKQAFMFRPVTDTMGSSPSTSSSSSAVSGHHLHSIHDPHQQQQQQLLEHHQQQVPHQVLHPLPTAPASHHHHHHHSDSSEASHHHHHHHHHHHPHNHHQHQQEENSGDVYMNDSEMRDHSDMTSVKVSEAGPQGSGFNFKPISPDHA